MRFLLITLTGFIAGAAMVTGVALIPTASSSATPYASHSIRVGSTAMSSRMMTSGVGRTMVRAQTVRLTIQHVERGCHVWSNGQTTGAMMRLRLKIGQTLSIMDMDVDAHRMMQFGGPTRMYLAVPMMMNHGMTMRFTRKGTYRFGTKTVQMPNAMDVKTIGPDNKLRLVVTVA
jgi:hypothetical protein